MSTSPIAITPEQIEAHYAVLDGIGRLGAGQGYARPAWSATETAAMHHIEQAAKAGGLNSRWDGVGNLIVETPGTYAEWVESGSHMDTVAGGGNYDGVAGVVAGLAVLQVIQAAALPLKRGLRLRVWRGEESSSFGIASMGSRAAFGRLAAGALAHRYAGRTLAEAMASQGADPQLVARGTPTITAAERDGIAAYVELHIEQGSVLETEGVEIGIVSGIRGSIRSRVMLTGAFDHSGATPMGRPYRCDVNLAMAHMLVRLDTLATEAIAAGRDIVQTVGVINSDRDINEHDARLYSNAVAKVSGFGYFTHEVRSCDGETARAFVLEVRRIIDATAAEFGIGAQVSEFSAMAGIPALDAGLQELLAECCRQQGAGFRTLASGAWHDAAVLCGERHGDGSPIPVGMLFIPSRGGISHAPAEFSSSAQIARGASVLASVLLRLAGR